MAKERSNIIALEFQETNETIAAEPMSEYNGNWLLARRALLNGDSQMVEEMQENKTIVIEE